MGGDKPDAVSGFRISLASEDDDIALDAVIRALANDPVEIVVSFVAYPDGIILGGGALDP